MSKTIYQTEIQIYYGKADNPTVTITRRNNESREYSIWDYTPTKASFQRLQTVTNKLMKKGRATVELRGRSVYIEPTD